MCAGIFPAFSRGWKKRTTSSKAPCAASIKSRPNSPWRKPSRTKLLNACGITASVCAILPWSTCCIPPFVWGNWWIWIFQKSFEARECVVFGKGDKERRVYFDAKAKLHLQDYLRSRTDANPALFVTLDTPFDRLKISGVEIRLRVGPRAESGQDPPA